MKGPAARGGTGIKVVRGPAWGARVQAGAAPPGADGGAAPRRALYAHKDALLAERAQTRLSSQTGQALPRPLILRS